MQYAPGKDPRVTPGGDEWGVGRTPTFHMGVMPAQAGIPLRAREAGPRLVPGVTVRRGGRERWTQALTRPSGTLSHLWRERGMLWLLLPRGGVEGGGAARAG